MSSVNQPNNQNQNRKRSRWGDRSTTTNTSRSSDAPSKDNVIVSDQEALQALLASANQKSNQDNDVRSNNYNHDNRHRDGNRRHHHHDRDTTKKPRRDDDTSKRGGPDYSYYGRDSNNNNNKSNNSYNNNNNKDKWGKQEQQHKSEEPDNSDEPPVDKEKPNFGLSGALAQEVVGELKFREPPEARAPNTLWRLHVFKGDDQIETLHISKQSAYLLGRNTELADIPLLHPSSSSQHAVIQFRALPSAEGKLQCRPYLMDLESTNGSFINGVRIDPARYYQLKKGDVLKFGASTREYVLLTQNTTSIK